MYVISYRIELVCKHFNVTITIIIPVFGNMSVLPCSYQNSKLCNIKCGCVPGHQKHLYKKYAAIIPNLLTALNLLVSICVSVCVRKFFVYYIQAVQINIKSFFLRLLLFLTVFLAFAFVCYAHCPCYCYYFCYSCCCCSWWCDFKKSAWFFCSTCSLFCIIFMNRIYTISLLLLVAPSFWFADIQKLPLILFLQV